MTELGNALELRLYRYSGPYIGMQNVKPVAVLKIYHDGSIVAWTDEPAFELGKAGIMLREGENAWDTVVRGIQAATKGVR
ncbi:MAG: hypothetical protein K2Y27_35105 [Xanthobacteraceae bacterium]|nr:hypothetical protein [Xanthobacteraceae bacterium]